MKINELKNSRKIDEGLGGALFGEVPIAALKGAFTGYGTTQQLAQDIFLRDFFQDAIVSLKNGIKSGWIDPKVSGIGSSPSGNSEHTSSDQSPKPSDAIPTTSPTQVPPAQQTGQKMSSQQTATAKMQTRAGVQPTGQKMTPAQRTQARLQAQKMRAAQKPKPVNESFNKLNQIFESIISEQEQPAEGNGVSITEYMLDWFGKYMEGVSWEQKKATVLPYIQEIEKTYNTDRGRGAIKKLAKVAFSLSKAYGNRPPAGAPSVAQPGAQPSPPNKLTPDQVVASIAALSPKEREEVISKVKKAR